MKIATSCGMERFNAAGDRPSVPTFHLRAAAEAETRLLPLRLHRSMPETAAACNQK